MSSGKVLQVIGPVVDVEFPLDEKLPEINDALKIKESDNQGRCILCVSFHYAKDKMNFPYA